MNLSVHQSSKEKHRQPEREGVDNIISAAKETGIRRLVYLSSLVHFMKA
jgi:nucleoside-diphosphate-sugar epimerase